MARKKRLTKNQKALYNLMQEYANKDVVDNTSIPVAGYLTFTDEKENGDSVDILSIITPDNEVFSCQSATFKRSFDNITNIMHGKQFSIIKVSGTTKAGRPYIDCALDVKSVK